MGTCADVVGFAGGRPDWRGVRFGERAGAVPAEGAVAFLGGPATFLGRLGFPGTAGVSPA